MAILRAFVRLCERLGANHAPARRLADLKKRYDARFRVVFTAPSHHRARACEVNPPSSSSLMVPDET